MDKNLVNITEYYEEVSSDYPGIGFEHFKIICSNPFKYVKERMASGLLKNIRLQYFGTFEVSPSRVKFSKKALTKNYERGVITEEKYFTRMNTLENYED